MSACCRWESRSISGTSIFDGPPQGEKSTVRLSTSLNPHFSYSRRPCGEDSRTAGIPRRSDSSNPHFSSREAAPRLWCFGSVCSRLRSDLRCQSAFGWTTIAYPMHSPRFGITTNRCRVFHSSTHPASCSCPQRRVRRLQG